MSTPATAEPTAAEFFDDTDLVIVDAPINEAGRKPLTPPQLLEMMRGRVRFYGSPLPDGFVPPPGIDLDALLKQIPWPPKDAQ